MNETELITTYLAAVATAADCVFGDFCDVQVLENEIIGYRETDDGELIPSYGMTNRLALNTIETDVRIDDEDAARKASAAADEILRANGWTRIESWTIGDTAMYAMVEKV